MWRRSLFCTVIILFSVTMVMGNNKLQWNCPSNSRYCFQWIPHPQTWNQTRSYCAGLGAQIPAARHLSEMRNLRQVQPAPFWTSLCFSYGRLQWLSENPREERDLFLIDTLLADLTSPNIVSDQLYCFYASGDLGDPVRVFGLALKDAELQFGGMCVSSKRTIHQPTAAHQRGWIKSTQVISLGAERNWGPIGQEREGYVGVFPSKYKTLRLKCDVKTTNPDLVVNYRWRRNGGYMGNNSEEIDFASQDDLIKWTGSVSCEAAYPGQQDEVISGPGLHLVMWNTVTLRLYTGCTTCRLQNVFEAAKVLLAQFVEIEIGSGFASSLEIFAEPPVIQRPLLYITVHLRNKRVDRFDFQMAQKLGFKRFLLSRWAQNRSLILPDGSDLKLELVSPCNAALPQDRNNNITWTGYLGQTFPSNNFIGGPICIDREGEIITRTCGREIPNEFKECAAMKPRRQQPRCFNGFDSAGGRCYRMTEETEYSNALSECWAGWQMHPSMVQTSLSEWVQDAISWMGRTRREDNITMVWLPLKRPNPAAPFQTPIWSWTSVSNRWIPEPSTWNVTQDGPVDEQCAAYDLQSAQLISQSCHARIPMICSRPTLPQPISSLVASQPDHVGEYFCPPGWMSHWLVLDSGVCYRRFILPEPISWDEGREECFRRGGDLATAPTHNFRIALEQVYGFFNNQSVVDSWIGFRNPWEIPAAFRWINRTTTAPSGWTYAWQPFNDFTAGYGVSAGKARMWWSWPRDTKLWGVLCQMNVTAWQDGLILRLEPSSNSIREGDYVLIFSYNPPPILIDQDEPPSTNYETIQVLQQTYAQKFFWEFEFDVICHFANFARHFRLPAGLQRQYRAPVTIPSSAGSGSLTCEAWLNRPAYRFHSNTIIHRPTNSYSFIFYVPIYYRDSIVIDLLQRSRILQEVMVNPSVTSSGFPNLVKLSFSLPSNVRRMEISTLIRRCDVGVDVSSDMRTEQLLHLLLRSCLPLTYQRGEIGLADIRSTVACPAEIGRGDQLSWPRTFIGRTIRPIQLCLSSRTQLVHRTCQGSFEQGAVWGEVMNGTAFTCQTPPESLTLLHQLERVAKNSLLDEANVATILAETLRVWEQERYPSLAELEITISILRHIMDSAGSVRVNRILVASILERVVYPGQSPLYDLQNLPHVLAEFVRILSDLPVLDGRGIPRTRLNLGDQVSVVAAESNINSQSIVPLNFEFDRVTVNITRDFRNRLNNGLTVVTLLPTELLAIDPIFRTNQIRMFKIDPTDRNLAQFLDWYTAEGTIVDVAFKTLDETSNRMLSSSSAITMAFTAELPSDSTILCARWDSPKGRWLSGECWHLIVNDHHVCQCNLPGIYGLFSSNSESFHALLRQLPIMITVAIFTLIAMCLVVRSACIYRQVVHELDLVEMGVRLQLLLAWVIMLLCDFSHYFVGRRSLGCIILSTGFQYVLTAAFMWLFTLLLVRQWQIQDRWLGSQSSFLIKLSLAVWGLSSLVVVTIPIYKLRFLHLDGMDVFHYLEQCQLEDPVDFGLTMAIVCVASLASFVLHIKNGCDQAADSGYFGMPEYFSGLATFLMALAGILAVISNSWLYSLPVSIIFGCVSSILGIVWLYTFWTLLPSPLVSHSFQHAATISNNNNNRNRTTNQDLRLKTIYGSSSIDFMSDR